ncbi:MAG: ubiquinol-cytochrome c reductase iron-sulfur subunit [Candidatus Brocadiales bacterium]
MSIWQRESRVSDTEKKVVQGILGTLSRRWMLLIVGWVGFLTFAGLVTLLTIVDFLKPKVFFGPSSKFKAGFPDEYQPGKVSIRWMKAQTVWIVRNKAGGIYAFSAICRHLGCIPTWVEDEQLFKCPCHGSNYDIEGDVVAGPAPRPLWRFGLSFATDGQIVVNKTVREDTPGKREKGPFMIQV